MPFTFHIVKLGQRRFLLFKIRCLADYKIVSLSSTTDLGPPNDVCGMCISSAVCVLRPRYVYFVCSGFDLPLQKFHRIVARSGT